VKLGVVVVLLLAVAAGLQLWWRNLRVAAPKAVRGGHLEPLARVLRGVSGEWDSQLVSAGLFSKDATGRVVRPRISAASAAVLELTPLPGSMPRWLHPATAANLQQIADYPVVVRQSGAQVVIRLAAF
jgi:hypothetical protein